MSETVVSLTDSRSDRSHDPDVRCVACDAGCPEATSYPRYACCNGTDCGCCGAVIPPNFCLLACWENYDPTPWCSGCGAMKKKDCHCGPFAENN